MVTTITNHSAFPPYRPEKRLLSPRFGAVEGQALEMTEKIAKAAGQEANIRGYRAADMAQKVFGAGLFNIDSRRGGLSLEDVAGRLQTLVGVYLLQGYYSIKDDKHPWETNGRNAMVWIITLLLQSLTKSENFGVNTLLFNPLMKQKGAESSRFEFVQNALDKTRMNVGYLDILKDAGIPMTRQEEAEALKGKKALWASSWLDNNKIALIKNRYETLKQKAMEGGAIKPEKLTAEERRIFESIPGFFHRINGWNGLSTAIIMGVTVYFIGGVAMRIVNKVISPLDKDFDGNQQPGQTGKPSPFANKGAAAKPPVFSHLPAFQNYISQRRAGLPTLPPGGTN